MALNYSKGIPLGDNNAPQFLSPPAVKALVTTVRESATVSSILILGQDTTALEIAATGGVAYLKWLTQSVVDSSVAGTSIISAAGTANFDHVIPTGTVRRFVVPIATQSNSQGYSSMVGDNRAYGLYPNIALSGLASVATTQYGKSNG